MAIKESISIVKRTDARNRYIWLIAEVRGGVAPSPIGLLFMAITTLGRRCAAFFFMTALTQFMEDIFSRRCLVFHFLLMAGCTGLRCLRIFVVTLYAFYFTLGHVRFMREGNRRHLCTFNLGRDRAFWRICRTNRSCRNKGDADNKK
jgi:hypothetical protein